MGRFIIKRVLMIIPVVLAVAIVVFTILYISPGDPVTLQLGDNYSPEQYEALAKDLGLDKGYFGQLFDFLKQFFLQLDFGKSWITKNAVAPELFSRLPRTAIIAAICMVLQVLVAIPLGVTAATHQNSFIDKFCIVLAMIGIMLLSSHSVNGFNIGDIWVFISTILSKSLTPSQVSDIAPTQLSDT